MPSGTEDKIILLVIFFFQSCLQSEFVLGDVCAFVNTAANMDLLSSEFTEGKPMLGIIAFHFESWVSV